MFLLSRIHKETSTLQIIFPKLRNALQYYHNIIILVYVTHLSYESPVLVKNNDASE